MTKIIVIYQKILHTEDVSCVPSEDWMFSRNEKDKIAKSIIVSQIADGSFECWQKSFAGLEKIDIDISEDERKTRLGSLKKVAISASTKFRHSLTKKGRRNSRVMSVVFDDEHDADEIQAVDALRQALILEELLPAKHDDYHMLLR